MTASNGSPDVGLVLDPLFSKHDPGPGHPEQVARYEAVTRAVEASGLLDKVRRIPIREATDDELSLTHTRSYIALARKEIADGASQLSTGDTSVCKESLDVGLHAAGSVCAMIDLVVTGEIRRGFCALRPPGHHATPDRGMGFCIFNNVAVGARYAQRQSRGAIERVAIVDWDVHHGNGTQDIFYKDPSVHFFSTHQSPLYPGTGARNETGEGPGKGTTLNRPFPAGADMDAIGGAFAEAWIPAMDAFKPQLVLISAGFDSRIDDPLGAFRLTDDDFASLTTTVREVAERHAQGRVVSCLEGGYNVEGLASAVVAHLRALTG